MRTAVATFALAMLLMTSCTDPAARQAPPADPGPAEANHTHEHGEDVHDHGGHAHDGHDHAPAPGKAVAMLVPTEGNDVQGTITFTSQDGKLLISGEVTGLTPGKHGFHIHEFGDLSAPDGAAAGGHFDPDGAPHGGPGAEQHHAGDLGNIEADDTGRAAVNIESSGLSLSGPHSILGRSIVVHAGEDDLSTQPSGDSGPRVAVGVIGVAQEQ